MLIALVGDKNSHGEGALETPPTNTTFTIGGKLIATVDTIAAGDDEHHLTGDTNASTGSSTFTIGGKAVHRENDQRYCGATTIVTSQSTFSLGS